jgi:bifunctional DNA-binding transcriptional regulator/antitoxin component of YhaV-PrlF toxin-antitoxin module
MDEVESEKVVSVSSRGHVTIPEEFQEELGIDVPGYAKFVRSKEGEVVIRPVTSVTDLRGILAGKTDEQGGSAVERLREERRKNAESHSDSERHRPGASGSRD